MILFQLLQRGLGCRISLLQSLTLPYVLWEKRNFGMKDDNYMNFCKLYPQLPPFQTVLARIMLLSIFFGGGGVMESFYHSFVLLIRIEISRFTTSPCYTAIPVYIAFVTNDELDLCFLLGAQDWLFVYLLTNIALLLFTELAIRF